MSSYECLYSKLKHALSTDTKIIMCDIADIANVLEELKSYRNLPMSYHKGFRDGVDELYSHRLKEVEDENDSLVYIQKSWFEKLKEDNSGVIR